MTITIIDGVTDYEISVNVPNVDPIQTYDLIVTSLYSNEALFQAALTIEETNDRYTTFSFTLPSTAGDLHQNAMANYSIIESGTTEIDLGSLKLIYTPGGQTGTQAYISNNEDREGVVYYRPAY